MSTQEARYFPMLRGRQNELLAIRELAEKGKLSHVTPIIEPVKASNTLIKTLSGAFSHGTTVGIVFNPTVGSFSNDLLNYPDFQKRYYSLIRNHKGRTQLFLHVANGGIDALYARLSQMKKEQNCSSR